MDRTEFAGISHFDNSECKMYIWSVCMCMFTRHCSICCVFSVSHFIIIIQVNDYILILTEKQLFRFLSRSLTTYGFSFTIILNYYHHIYFPSSFKSDLLFLNFSIRRKSFAFSSGAAESYWTQYSLSSQTGEKCQTRFEKKNLPQEIK